MAAELRSLSSSTPAVQSGPLAHGLVRWAEALDDVPFIHGLRSASALARALIASRTLAIRSCKALGIRLPL